MQTAILFLDSKGEVTLRDGIPVEKGNVEYYVDLGNSPNPLHIPLNLTTEVRDNVMYYGHIRRDDSYKYRITQSDPSKGDGVLLLVKGVSKIQNAKRMSTYLVHGTNQIVLIHDPKTFRGSEIKFTNGITVFLDKETLLEILN